jgi:hypothetical protein
MFAHGTKAERTVASRVGATNQRLRRAAVNAMPVPDLVPPIVHQVLSSPGRPLEAETRALLGPRFGRDFSQVRVHADSRAAESARAVNALAYTVGNDLVFGANRYAPQLPGGQRLLAHELTHVMQQQGSTSQDWAHSDLGVSHPTDPLESEAEAVASSVESPQRLPRVHSGSGGVIARQAVDDSPLAPDRAENVSDEAAGEIETVVAGEFETRLGAGPGQGGAGTGSAKTPSPSTTSRKAAQRKTYATDVKISLPATPTLDRSLTTAQVSALAKDDSGATAGLTQFKLPYNTAVMQAYRGKKHWVTSIKVSLTNPSLTVFLTSQNAVGSCADKDLLRQEIHHVADDQKNTAAGEKAVQDGTASPVWPDVTQPTDDATISRSDLRKEITTMVDLRMWEIQHNNWTDGCAWDTLDYPKMYASCAGMSPLKTAPSCKAGDPGKAPEVFAPPLPRKTP